MNTRVTPFANLDEPPVFAPKPKPSGPVEKESIARMAKEQGFPSREAPRNANPPKRKPRIHLTGRNQQFNAKATPETIQRFYKMAAEKNVVLGELLRLCLDAMEATEVLNEMARTRKIALPELVKHLLDGWKQRQTG
jgi:hypothetical protein